MTTADRRARGTEGLTLLEVLAAAMIFAMVMTVLIGTSSTAVHHVGASARRLEATLVADGILADLEIQMKQGIAPLIGEEETEFEHFVIRIVQTDLVPSAAAARPATATPARAISGVSAAGLDVAAMLGAGLPEVAKHLKQYDIEVSWVEQDGVQSVRRTTFAFDWETAAIEFADLFENRSGGGANAFASDSDSDTEDPENAAEDYDYFGDGKSTEAQKATFREQRRRGAGDPDEQSGRSRPGEPSRRRPGSIYNPNYCAQNPGFCE